MEKFCLKWNDFQTNVSKTFSSLRQEEHLFDVTLVSDDEQHIAAHKLVLSASSQLFKTMLKKASHSNPLIFLNGFRSHDLSLIMDYIYQGEVQILQSDLDSFLDVAQQLKIEGLIGGEENSSNENTIKADVEDIESNYSNDHNIEKTAAVFEDPREKLPKTKTPRAERTVASVSSSSYVDAKAAVDDIVEKTEEGWMCKVCGKTTKTLDIRRHAEIHIEGLSFDCQLCDKTFRSRNSLKLHRHRHHQ